MTTLGSRPDASGRQAQRHVLGHIQVAQGKQDSRLVRVLTAVSPAHEAEDGLERAAARRSPSPPVGDKMKRPATLPSRLGPGDAGGRRARGARPTAPALPASLREHLATQVPVALAERLYAPGELAGAAAAGAEPPPLEMLTCHAPETRTTYLITTPEGRLDSTAKRRRWAVAVPPEGQAPSSLLCCLEFLLPKESGRPLSDDQQLARIQHELKNLSQFNRDIEVHALLKTADHRYLALMTNLPEEGSYLLDQVAEPLFDHAVLRFFSDAATRLHEDIHKQGLVHGDFKLSNVMVTEQGRASLIDLDTLAAVDADGLADIHATTFVPPEQRAPTHAGAMTRFGRAGDVFAVGLALFDAYAERDARTYDLAASRATGSAQVALEGRAGEIRAIKAQVLHEMTARDTSFYAWREEVLAGGYDAERVRRDQSAYGRSMHAMQRRAPELFAHWLTRLSSPEPQDRSSLAPTLALLQALRSRPEGVAAERAVEQELRDIAAESMSAYVAPVLAQQAEAVRTPPASPQDRSP